MPNLYNKLMAKDMPGAAPAPTSRQMVKARMGLRSAMRKYAEGGDIPPEMSFPLESPYKDPKRPDERIIYEPRRPDPEPMRYSPEPTRPPLPEEPRRPEEPRYEEPRRPEIYPQDYAGPRTTGTSQTQQVGPRTSYRQNADGSLTEIGYDGQPISGYTPEQMAMHKATMGVTPSEFQYVYNGQGYDKVRTGGITMDDGTFIAGYDNPNGGMEIGTPSFFQKYANDPITMARLREMYGFTGAEPEYQQPQIGYNPIENIARQNPGNMPIDTRYNQDEGYDEPPMFDVTPEQAFDPIEYQNKQRQAGLGGQLGDLLKALQGRGTGSSADSQKLAQLLQSLGYSK